ncbi:hypothetical protein M0R45_022090 [Rubus argutus]|uniref:Aminotransferase-like plant mobile domain-containing protein n=1 Tax=Rubus argutus TaxID=59490 RepID=A0AAW1XFF3_RUBAR
MGRIKSTVNTRGGRSGRARGGKSLGSGNIKPQSKQILESKAATKPVSSSGDLVSGDSLNDNDAASHGPADCRVYGVKAYKPVGRNPSHPKVHIDPNNHLSYKMNVGEIKGCGSNRLCSHWYKHLPKLVQDRIVHAGFGEFIKCLVTTGRRDRQLVIALAGDGGTLPILFTSITLAHTKHKELLQFFGKRLADIAKPTMTYTEILDSHADWEPRSADDVDRLARVFILCLIGSTLCAGRTNTVNLYYLPCLKNLDEIGTFNWGGAGLSCLYRNMDSLSRGKCQSIGGYWRAWELWACEYLMPLALFKPLHGPNTWPRAMRWFGAPDIRECPHSLEDFRVTLRYLTADKVVTNPWGTETSNSLITWRTAFLLPTKGSITGSGRLRVVLRGEGIYSELRHTKARVPTLPPRTMLPDYRLDKQDIKDGLQGWEASTCLMNEDSDYASYRSENLVYRHQPIETFKVDAKQVSELLDIIVGQNSIIFELCMDANKEFQAKRALAEKYESRPTLQSSPTIHVDVDKPDDHHKKSPLGEEFFCYESNEDDNDNDGMYTDGDDVGGDDEQDDEFADVDGNGDENEDWENGLGLVAETNIAPPNEETNDSSKVINTSDVAIPMERKRARKPSTRDMQPPLNKRRRAG